MKTPLINALNTYHHIKKAFLIRIHLYPPKIETETLRQEGYWSPDSIQKHLLISESDFFN